MAPFHLIFSRKARLEGMPPVQLMAELVEEITKTYVFVYSNKYLSTAPCYT